MSKIKILGNTLVLNRHRLTDKEVATLMRYPMITANNDLFVFCSNTDLWKGLAEKMTLEDVELLRSVVTDSRKAHVTINGMTEMNIPPFGTIQNPTPNWLAFHRESNDVFVSYVLE